MRASYRTDQSSGEPQAVRIEATSQVQPTAPAAPESGESSPGAQPAAPAPAVALFGVDPAPRPGHAPPRRGVVQGALGRYGDSVKVFTCVWPLNVTSKRQVPDGPVGAKLLQYQYHHDDE